MYVLLGVTAGTIKSGIDAANLIPYASEYKYYSIQHRLATRINAPDQPNKNIKYQKDFFASFGA